MEIKVTVKQLGKKRPTIAHKPITIQDLPPQPTLSNLITAVVIQQVQAFNQKIDQQPLIPFLLKEEINDKTETGKVGFGAIYNNEKANEQEAIDNALLAFEDGIYCVFIDEQQIEQLNEPISITENSTLAFIRLTFLAGSYW